MILPCRIHQAGNRVDSLPLAFFFAISFLAFQAGHAEGQDSSGSSSQQAGVSWLPAIPIQITAGVDTGYNDNVNLSPNGQGSVFARENVVLTYNRPGDRTDIYLLGVGRFSQFFDVSGQNETSGNVTLGLTHNFSSRLSFYASIYGSYQNEPNFRSNVGPENVRTPYFDTTDIFSVTYHWLLRLTTITSYTLERVQYTSSSIGTSQNRLQSTFGEQFQFSLTSRTNLIGEYRFETINYDTAPMDSTTHFILAGVNHNLTEHLIVHARAGESFRSQEDEGSMASPYLESVVDYVSSNHSLSWTSSYGFESPTSAGTTTTKTWRTGLTLTYGLTSRITSTTGIFYHHDENSGGTGTTASQDSFDLNASLRYMVNKHFTVNLGYNHTTLGSLGSVPGYSSNSYFAGLTYVY